MTLHVRLTAALALTLGALFAGDALAQTTRPASRPDRPEKPTTPADTGQAPKAPATAENDPKAIEVVDRYLEAIGGRKNLAAIHEREAHFENRKFTATNVTPMTMVRFLKKNPKLEVTMIREEWELPPMGLSKDPLHFVQVYNGEEGFVKAMGHVSPLTGPTLTVFVWDKPIDDQFVHWKKDGYTLKYVQTADVDGVPCDVVETTSYAGKQKMRYYFSQADGLLLKKEWTEPGQRGMVKKEVLFSEYIKIKFRDDAEKWVKFPINQTIFEGGELSLQKEFSKIVINGGISDTVFGRPEGPDFEERPMQPKGEEKKDEAPKEGAGDQKPTSRPK